MNTVTLEFLLEGKTPSRRRSGPDLISMIREGISAKSLDTLAKTARLSSAELGDALGIPQRTLARRKNQGILTAEESAKVVRLARCISRASEVFEDLDKAIDWLKQPNRALERAAPLSLLDTDVGMEAVSDLLGRIEHGVFS